VPHRAGDRDVVELHAGSRTAQHQPAPTHVAAAYEVSRKKQSLAEDRQQDVDILARGDASEQNDPCLRGKRARQPLCIATQRTVDLALPAPADKWQAVAFEALRYIVDQWHLGFGEARHIMEFAPALGLGGPQHQRGDIFQRAIVADALCDADAVLGGMTRSILDQEVAYLASRRDPGRAGWRYFPELPELPPDADDLAQIMQAFWRAGHRRELEEHCEEPLSILFDGSHTDGSFETWIIPALDRTEAEIRQAECARTMWGTGPDAEVVANLLYALALVDPKRFADRIDRGTSYLEAVQRSDGGWESTWYHGPFYGTYVCLRLLACARPDSDAVRRAAAMLRATQNADGGWGGEGASTALETSLALLGLAAVAKAGADLPEDGVRAARALGRLDRDGRDDGSWPADDFIRMQVGRATGGPTYVLSYGSRTLTTTYVMKAALAWSRSREASVTTASGGVTETPTTPYL